MDIAQEPRLWIKYEDGNHTSIERMCNFLASLNPEDFILSEQRQNYSHIHISSDKINKRGLDGLSYKEFLEVRKIHVYQSEEPEKTDFRIDYQFKSDKEYAGDWELRGERAREIMEAQNKQ